MDPMHELGKSTIEIEKDLEVRYIDFVVEKIAQIYEEQRDLII